MQQTGRRGQTSPDNSPTDAVTQAHSKLRLRSTCMLLHWISFPLKIETVTSAEGARSSVVGWGTTLQAG
jgi:hypothetical protein